MGMILSCRKSRPCLSHCRRLHFILACLLASSSLHAAEVRLAFPAAYAEDVFVKSLLTNKTLTDAGLTLAPQKLATEAEALRAAKTGAAELAVFTLAAEDLHALEKKSGDETSLLTRPFMFKSAAEVFLCRIASSATPRRPTPAAPACSRSSCGIIDHLFPDP